MAERLSGYQFKSVQLLKDQSLGIGSYGAVCKAMTSSVLPTLFDPTEVHHIAPQREHRLPTRCFEQECGSVRAKVTDFVMARLGDIHVNPQATRSRH